MGIAEELMKISRELRAAGSSLSLLEVQEDWFKSLGDALTEAVKFSDYRKPSIERASSEGLRWSHGFMDMDDPDRDGADRVTYVFELKRDIHFWVLYNGKEIAHTSYSLIRTIDFVADAAVEFAYEAAASEFA